MRPCYMIDSVKMPKFCASSANHGDRCPQDTCRLITSQATDNELMEELMEALRTNGG